MATAPQATSITPSQPFEAVPFQCVGCGGDRPGRKAVLRADHRQRPFDLLRCGRCGLIQQHPRYTSGRLVALYDPAYYVFNEPESLRWARAVQQYVVHILPWESRQARRLLDVGCALGHFAALARRRGWRVIALDVSPEAVSRAVVAFDLEVRAGSLSQHRQTLPPFDLIFLGDVIEHVPDPARLLAEVGSVLVPHGVVCIDTPNRNSRWRKLGRRRWLGLNRYHINLFDAGSLAALLDRSGFVEIHSGSYTHYRYESLARRPQVEGWIRWLPNLVAWRVNRVLSGLDRFSRWTTLRAAGPTTLEEANHCVDMLARHRPRTSRHTADNLTATARRQPNLYNADDRRPS